MEATETKRPLTGDQQTLIECQPEPEREIKSWEDEAMYLLCSIPVEPQMAKVSTLAADHDLSSQQIIKLCGWLLQHRNMQVEVRAGKQWVTLAEDGAEVALAAASIWWERNSGKVRERQYVHTEID